MKVQVRRGVFETNSSSTHSLTLYKKEEWDNIKNGEGVIDESWHSDGTPKFNTKSEIKESKAFKQYLKDNNDGDVEELTEDAISDALNEFMYEECIYDYDSYCEQYEVLQKEVPNSDYVAVSIFSYEG